MHLNAIISYKIDIGLSFTESIIICFHIQSAHKTSWFERLFCCGATSNSKKNKVCIYMYPCIQNLSLFKKFFLKNMGFFSFSNSRMQLDISIIVFLCFYVETKTRLSQILPSLIKIYFTRILYVYMYYYIGQEYILIIVKKLFIFHDQITTD